MTRGLILLLLLAGCRAGGDELPIAGERAAPDEAAIARRLIDVTKEASRRRHPEGPTRRFNQPRHVGCVAATFSVEPDLPADLGVGLFSTPRSYPAWIRFANASDGPDTEEDFRGMSIKLMQVEGVKLLGSVESLDFTLNSHPVLFVGTPGDFLAFIERSLGSSPILFFLNPFDLHLRELRIVLAGRKHHSSHLTIPYWSTTPYLHGEGSAVKYSARPCGEAAPTQPDEPVDGYLLAAMREQLSAGGACFDFMVQLQTDPVAMPIEDATVEWDESISPFRRVAEIRIPPQPFESPERMELCENLAFNPWNTLAEHRPLGGLNRVRKDLYRELAAFRHQRNGVTYTEPTGTDIP